MIARQVGWVEENQRYLTAALASLRQSLEEPDVPARPVADLEELAAAMSAPPAIERIRAAFSLSEFERDLLLLCAGTELDSTFPEASFGLALAMLPHAHWSALAPVAPLRRWRLIEFDPGGPLTSARLRIDERVLHELAGVPYLDERLLGLVEPVASAVGLPVSRGAIAERLARLWAASAGAEKRPVVQLCGDDRMSSREVLACACEQVGMVAFAMQAADVPASPPERDALARLWEREAVLGGSVLLVERGDDDPVEAVRSASRLVEAIGCPVVLAGRDPVPLTAGTSERLTISPLGVAERAGLWRASLGVTGDALDGHVDVVAAQFALSTEAVRAAAADALGRDAAPHDEALWSAAREQTRPRLDDLARRIDLRATWDDLVLPEAQLRALRDIALQVRNRARVYETWGFAAKSARGLGIGALFTGQSGTGKTMAAEVLASELALDLYRIDLSAVVSKYIGETEKNLRRVFDAAEGGGAILLFDEADALFGKRSEVKDGHDRYANIEVGYLLQRMEAYRGLAILTTNMRGALDSAFLRRLRFRRAVPVPGHGGAGRDLAQDLPGAGADRRTRPRPACATRRGRRIDPQHRARCGVPGGRRPPAGPDDAPCTRRPRRGRKARTAGHRSRDRRLVMTKGGALTVHIEQLVLHGISPENIEAEVASELARLVEAREAPWPHENMAIHKIVGEETVHGGHRRASAVGNQVALEIFRGLNR